MNEWQKQQQALKVSERNNLKRASIERQKYRGGEDDCNDIKHQKQQKVLKEADREKQKRASLERKNYRGGEHDIKHQKQLKLLKEAHLEESRRASLLRHRYHGGEHDIKDYERAIMERRKKNNATWWEIKWNSKQEEGEAEVLKSTALIECQQDGTSKASGVENMTTTTESPLGSEHNLMPRVSSSSPGEKLPAKSSKSNISLKSIISASSPENLEKIDAENNKSDDCIDDNKYNETNTSSGEKLPAENSGGSRLSLQSIVRFSAPRYFDDDGLESSKVTNGVDNNNEKNEARSADACNKEEGRRAPHRVPEPKYERNDH